MTRKNNSHVPVTSKKAAIIENSAELRGKLGEAALISQDKGEVIGDHYKLLPVDLCDMQQFDNIISLANMDLREDWNKTKCSLKGFWLSTGGMSSSMSGDEG